MIQVINFSTYGDSCSKMSTSWPITQSWIYVAMKPVGKRNIMERQGTEFVEEFQINPGVKKGGQMFW